jgi:hypothetical protein
VRRTWVAASLLLAVLGPVAATASTRGQDSGKGCNVRLKGLKTLSDPQRKLVNLHPRTTTIRAINRRRAPRTRRRDAFERQVWRVNAQIVEYKAEADSDIHLVLFGQGGYLIAEMPAASCLPRTTAGPERAAADSKREVASTRPLP